MVESTKDEIKKVSLRNLSEENIDLHDQPLLAETKDYKRLLKNVSSLMNKQLKSQKFEPVKRDTTDDLQKDIKPVKSLENVEPNYQSLRKQVKRNIKKLTYCPVTVMIFH